MIENRDWVVKPRFDGSEVEEGLKKQGLLFQKAGKDAEAVEKKQAQAKQRLHEQARARSVREEKQSVRQVSRERIREGKKTSRQMMRDQFLASKEALKRQVGKSLFEASRQAKEGLIKDPSLVSRIRSIGQGVDQATNPRTLQDLGIEFNKLNDTMKQGITTQKDTNKISKSSTNELKARNKFELRRKALRTDFENLDFQVRRHAKKGSPLDALAVGQLATLGGGIASAKTPADLDSLKSELVKLNSTIRQSIVSNRDLQLSRDKTAREDRRNAKQEEALSARKSRLRDTMVRGDFNTGRSRYLSQGQSSDFRAEQSMLREGLANATTVAQVRALEKAQSSLNERVRQATIIGRENANAMNAQKFAANGLMSSLSNLARSYVSIYALMSGGRMFYEVGTAFDSMKAAMLAASGDAKMAGQNFEFLVETSRRLGTDVLSGTEGFNKLGIAMRAAGFEQKELQDVYTAVAESSAAFSLDKSRQSLVFFAISQMASKAKISAEELQRQLGDSLPTALEAMRRAASEAYGMEISSAGELMELVKQGKVLSRDVLIPFGKELRNLASEGGALAAAIEKVRAQAGMAKTELLLGTNIGFEKNQMLFAGAWGDVKQILTDLQPLFKVFGFAFGGLFKLITATVKLFTPVIKPFVTGLAWITDSLVEYFQLIEDSSNGHKKSFTIWEKSLLQLARAFLYFVGTFEQFFLKIGEIGDWMSSDSKNPIEKLGKGVASLIAGLIALKGVWKVMKWAIMPFWSILKSTLGIMTKIINLKDKVPTPVKDVAQKAAKTGMRRVPVIGTAIGAAGLGMDIHEKGFTTAVKDFLARGIEAGTPIQFIQQEMLELIRAGTTAKPSDMLKNNSPAQTIQLTNVTTLDGRIIARETSNLAIENINNQMLLSQF